MITGYKTWEERCRETQYRFKVLAGCETTKFRMERVHPLKQRLVMKIAEYVNNTPEISHVCIIGSAISMKCNIYSDLDLIIQLGSAYNSGEVKNKVSERIQELSDWNTDILWYDHLSEEDRIYQEIERGLFIK